MIKIFYLLFLFLYFYSGYSFASTNYCSNGNLGLGWKFSESSGNAIDCTSNSNTGTVGSQVSLGITGYPGFSQTTYDFFNNSSNGLVWAAASSSINNLSTVSMGAWIKPNSFGGSGNKCSGATIIGKSDGSHGPELCLNTNGSISFQANWSGGGITWTTTTTPVTTGSWQHISVTYSYSSTGNTPKIYYNGVSQSVNSQSPFGSQGSDSGNELTVGVEYAYGGVGQAGHFDGYIEQVFYANTTLSSTDITNIINNGIDGTQGVAPTVILPTTINSAVIKSAIIG